MDNLIEFTKKDMYEGIYKNNNFFNEKWIMLQTFKII